eukprot:gene10625-11750_t
MAIVLLKNRLPAVPASKRRMVWCMFKKFAFRFFIVVFYASIGAGVFMTIEEGTTTNTASTSKNNALKSNETAPSITRQRCLAITNLSVSRFTNEMRMKLANVSDAFALKAIANEILLYSTSANKSTTCNKEPSSIVNKNSTDEKFNKWLYFSFITIMTIGYGDVTAKTYWGKGFVIIFSVIGIPLMLWLLALSGQIQTACLRELTRLIYNAKRKVCGKQSVKSKRKADALTTFLSALLVIIVHIIGAASIHESQGWSFFDSLYFWFCTTATIGYGDFVSGPMKLSTGIVWLLAKLFALAQMAGLINTVLCWLEARNFARMAYEAKKLSQTLRKKGKYDLKKEIYHNNSEVAAQVTKKSVENKSTIQLKEITFDERKS